MHGFYQTTNTEGTGAIVHSIWKYPSQSKTTDMKHAS
jgi:hypothetical protein